MTDFQNSLGRSFIESLVLFHILGPWFYFFSVCMCRGCALKYLTFRAKYSTLFYYLHIDHLRVFGNYCLLHDITQKNKSIQRQILGFYLKIRELKQPVTHCHLKLQMKGQIYKIHHVSNGCFLLVWLKNECVQFNGWYWLIYITLMSPGFKWVSYNSLLYWFNLVWIWVALVSEICLPLHRKSWE